MDIAADPDDEIGMTRVPTNEQADPLLQAIKHLELLHGYNFSCVACPLVTCVDYTQALKLLRGLAKI